MAELNLLAGFTVVTVGTLVSQPNVGWIQLARPEKSNAFNGPLWAEFPKAVQELQRKPDVRVIVVCGAGKNFCSGIDVSYLMSINASASTVSTCPATMRDHLRNHILQMQESFSSLERCSVPVIAAIHGMCVGAGVDLVTACDLRLCTDDAIFCVKEVDVAITADMGTLQRLPHLVGHGRAMDLALTARNVSAKEAAGMGLVTRVVPGGSPGVLAAAAELAASLASKPALAVRGTKRNLLYTRDNAVPVALDYVATWNSAQLISEDLARGAQQAAQKLAGGRAGGVKTAPRPKL